MKAVNKRDTLLFDSNDSRCRCYVQAGGDGFDYLHVQALDLGMPENRHTKPLTKRYRCIIYEHDRILDRIHEALEKGQKDD